MPVLVLLALVGLLAAQAAPRFAPPSPKSIPTRWHGGYQVPGLLVLHATVGPTKAGSAVGVAEFFRDHDEPTSAHYCVDEAEVVQCVGDHQVAYHCGYNDNSIGIEMCFLPLATSLANWLLPNRANAKRVGDHVGVRWSWLRPDVRRMMRRTAQLTAELALAYDIPLRYLTDDELADWDRAGRPARLGGIVTHAQMSRVFRKSTHWDPGAWPSGLFLKVARRRADRLRSKAAA